jgi:hypothetical protein
VLFLLADGSPGDGSPNTPVPITGAGEELVSGGDLGDPVLVVTGDGRLLQLSGNGQWTRRLAGGVVAAAYPG